MGDIEDSFGCTNILNGDSYLVTYSGGDPAQLEMVLERGRATALWLWSCGCEWHSAMSSSYCL